MSYDTPQSDPIPVRQLDVDAWQQALENGLMMGSDTAKIKIVEFYDYECPFCRRIQPNLDEIRQKYQQMSRLFFGIIHSRSILLPIRLQLRPNVLIPKVDLRRIIKRYLNIRG